MKVVDASVIYKWYSPEESSETALQLLRDTRDGEQLCAPDLGLYEIANVLRFAPGISAAEIDFVLDNLAAHDIQFEVISLPLLKDAARLALKHGITVYDAVYVALARSLGCEFVTADRKLARKLGSLAFVRVL